MKDVGRCFYFLKVITMGTVFEKLKFRGGIHNHFANHRLCLGRGLEFVLSFKKLTTDYTQHIYSHTSQEPFRLNS